MVTIDDFAKLYMDLYNINKRIYAMETTHPEKVGTKMVKIIKLTARYVSGNVNLSFDTDPTGVSQYERVVLELKLVDFPENDYAVRLHISSPATSDGNETSKDDFTIHSYMFPQTHDFNTFRIPLQKTLGDTITIGDKNDCPFLIEVLSDTNSLESNILALSLYKSNTSQSYSVNDLTSIFLKINELKERQDQLEE